MCAFFNSYRIAAEIACLVLFLSVVALVLERPSVLLKYFAFFFAAAANISGVISVELLPSFYLSEIRTFTYFAGSLPLIVLGWWCFICVLYIADATTADKQMGTRNEFSERAKKWLPLMSAGVFALCLMLFIRVFPHPSFALGLDRFSYSSQYIQGVWGSLTSYMAFLIIIPIVNIRENKSGIGIVTVALYCIYLFWTGTKFGDFFTVACLFCLVYFDKLKDLGVSALRKLVSVALCVCFAVIAFTGFAYSFTSSTSIADFYSIRTAQQGQLWWSSFIRSDSSIHLSKFLKNEVPALFEDKSISENIGAQNGIYGMMYLSAPASVVDAKLSTGSRYTEAGFACSYYYFGPFGVIAYGAITGLLAVFVVNGVLNALSRGEFLSTVIQVRFFALLRTARTMFIFSQFLTPLSLLCACYLLFKRTIRGGRNTAASNQFISSFTEADA